MERCSLNDEAWKVILAIPLFIIGYKLFEYSPARIIKRLLGKDYKSEKAKTFTDFLIVSFLDIFSILLSIIIIAVTFHWFYNLFQ